MWEAYNSTLVYSKENTIQAQVNYRLTLIAHMLSQQNSKSPKPFKQEPSDFLFKPRVNGREEAEDWINND